MSAKPDVAVGDDISFRNADGYVLHGRVIRVFDDYVLVNTNTTVGRWRQIVRFAQIQAIHRAESGAGQRPGQASAQKPFQNAHS